jgi:hypothetical protein
MPTSPLLVVRIVLSIFPYSTKNVKGRDLSHVNNAGDTLVGSGKYELTIGGGQRGSTAAAVAAVFEIRGATKTAALNDRRITR